MESDISISIREIEPGERLGIANLLAKGLGYQPSRFLQIFEAIDQLPLVEGFPRYGFVLLNQNKPVGALITIHSYVINSAQKHVRCHLSGWYVEPKFAFYSTLLEKRATRNSNVSYINTSARHGTYKIIYAQGFRKYTLGKLLIPTVGNLLGGDKDAKIVGHEGVSPPLCDSLEYELMSIHAKAGCICLWGVKDNHARPFVFRKKMLKGFVPCVQLIFCRDISDIKIFAGSLSRNLLKRGFLFISMDANEAISGLNGFYFEGLEPRFYKGIAPPIGDLAYTLNAISPIVRRGRNGFD